MVASRDGKKLLVTVGERGMDLEAGRAAIWEVAIVTGRHGVFASGLRNQNGLAWEPDSGVRCHNSSAKCTEP